MIDRITNLAGSQLTKSATGAASTGETGGANFADMLKKQIGEVSQMQQDASQAVQDLATGKNKDVTGVFVAVEKSETAFKTLLAIRSKLLDAYDEIKNMPI
ncbi:MAG: flagellar hook-basal body complex protein FliE [Tepidisphaeraceae bacterium]